MTAHTGVVIGKLRSREAYAAIARASAWQAGGFARTKRIVAERILRLIADGDDLVVLEQGPFHEVTFLEAMLAQVEQFEADGDVEPAGLTDADVIEEIERGLAKGPMGEDGPPRAGRHPDPAQLT